MSHDGDKTCKFGHVLLTNTHEDRGDVSAGGVDPEVHKKIVDGTIGDLNELKNENKGIDALVGEPWKTVKVQSDSQGFPRAAALDAADKWDEDLDYTVKKTEEKIFVSPQSQLHGEYMQRKNQSEQNVRETMRNISNLTQQKHMLEHDIRKLRTRAENMRSGDENIIKGDFIELVDGAGAAGGQGGDEASLKFYRDNNIYPSIVADFQEMRGHDDLKDPEKSKYDRPRLNEVPNNEKAILKKKWAMYEKWKDLYGSEIQRKLKDLKQQLRSIERSINETKDWLAPYVRDMLMINEGGLEDLKGEMNTYFTFKGTATQFRRLEFIAYKGMVNDHGIMKIAGDEDPTHYRVIYITALHINLAGWDQPQTPAQGPSVAQISLHPIITCKHVFENFFKQKIERQQNQLEQVVKEYKGESLTPEDAEKLKKARKEADDGDGISIEKLRQKVADEADGDIPVEFSATIRRIEDGIDSLDEINERYSGDDEDVLEIMEEVLDAELRKDNDEDDEMYGDLEKKVRSVTGQTDKFKIPDEPGLMQELRDEMKFNYYYDFKLGLGLYTMK